MDYMPPAPEPFGWLEIVVSAFLGIGGAIWLMAFNGMI
jgi:hypothetical protein